MPQGPGGGAPGWRAPDEPTLFRRIAVDRTSVRPAGRRLSREATARFIGGRRHGARAQARSKLARHRGALLAARRPRRPPASGDPGGRSARGRPCGAAARCAAAQLVLEGALSVSNSPCTLTPGILACRVRRGPGWMARRACRGRHAGAQGGPSSPAPPPADPTPAPDSTAPRHR